MGLVGNLLIITFMVAHCFSDNLQRRGLTNYMADKIQKVTFYEALALCRTYGMELVNIETEEEELAIEEYMQTVQPLLGVYNGFWIAGTRQRTNGTDFVWITTGKPVNYKNPTHFDNYKGKENCLEWYTDEHGKIRWNDIKCDARLAFICQITYLPNSY